MLKNVDNRLYEIEKIREENLEKYYSENVYDPNNFMNLQLNMFIEKDKLLQNDLYRVFHKSKFKEKITLHPQQVECINLLFKNNNMLLSAPTSFGKTFVAFEFICRNNFDNIVFVVPTIALLNEIVKKVTDKFSGKYNIITNSFESLEDKNIIIIVPERVDIEFLDKVKNIDFLIFDEIYKLKRSFKENGEIEDNKRIIALNVGYFDLVARASKVLLLGPFIKDITFSRTKLTNDIVKYFSDYSPIFNRIFFIDEDKNTFVIRKVFNDNESKLVFFKSPGSIYKFCSEQIKSESKAFYENSLTRWCDKYISDKWLPSLMLKMGIGIHHGNLPSFMRRYIENLYNSESIKTVLCTSTLLEGINTPTNELICYEASSLSSFELNNLIGRVGRLGTNKIGNVFLFDKELEKKLLGDAKYESIEIVAEDIKAFTIEEVLYLNKEKDALTEEQKNRIDELNKNLNKYGKELEELIEMKSFNVDELERFFKIIPKLIEKLNKLSSYINSSDEDEKQKISMVRGEIIELLMEVVPLKNSVSSVNSYIKAENEKNIKKQSLIKASVCVNKLLNLSPKSIYSRIQKIIENESPKLDVAHLNLLIDYLFDLGFSYIKYELSKIVKYSNFIFDEEFKNGCYYKDAIDLFNKEILVRFEIFNSNQNAVIKILIDLNIPYSDAQNLENIIAKNLPKDKISTSKVYKAIEDNYDRIKNSSKIDQVTKDLIDVMLNKN